MLVTEPGSSCFYKYSLFYTTISKSKNFIKSISRKWEKLSLNSPICSHWFENSINCKLWGSGESGYKDYKPSICRKKSIKWHISYCLKPCVNCLITLKDVWNKYGDHIEFTWKLFSLLPNIIIVPPLFNVKVFLPLCPQLPTVLIEKRVFGSLLTCSFIPWRKIICLFHGIHIPI